MVPHPRFPLIDGFDFAAAGASQQGAWPVGAFPRLRGLLHDESGVVKYELRGSIDAHGRHRLALGVNATLRLTCQRCLEAVEVAVQEQAMLWLARSQSEIDAQPLAAEGEDGVVASREMAVRDLVEDELLLALPSASRHEDCSAQAGAAPEGRQRPFEGLRSMLRGKQRH
ncbi:MAG: YceD family protein [Burkholderiales bacterium]